jgi:uncharacterized membrane protein
MDKSQRNSILNKVKALGRGGVLFVAGFVVAKGKIDFEEALTYIGIVLTLLGGGLTTQAHTDKSIVMAAAQVPAVTDMRIEDEHLAEAAKAAAPETTIVKGTSSNA